MKMKTHALNMEVTWKNQHTMRWMMKMKSRLNTDRVTVDDLRFELMGKQFEAIKTPLFL